MAKIFFPAKTLKKMKDLGISEDEIRDVFNYGTPLKFKNGNKGVEKKFEFQKLLIGCTYATSNVNDEHSITGVWKRKLV